MMTWTHRHELTYSSRGQWGFWYWRNSTQQNQTCTSKPTNTIRQK